MITQANPQQCMHADRLGSITVAGVYLWVYDVVTGSW